MIFHILIDDQRNLDGMDFIIRTPDAAYDFVDMFDTSGHYLYMDNDLADDKEYLNEGQSILSYILNQDQRPKKVVLVTSNSVAAENMRKTLEDFNYVGQPNRVEYDLK